MKLNHTLLLLSATVSISVFATKGDGLEGDRPEVLSPVATAAPAAPFDAAGDAMAALAAMVDAEVAGASAAVQSLDLSDTEEGDAQASANPHASVFSGAEQVAFEDEDDKTWFDSVQNKEVEDFAAALAQRATTLTSVVNKVVCPDYFSHIWKPGTEWASLAAFTLNSFRGKTADQIQALLQAHPDMAKDAPAAAAAGDEGDDSASSKDE